MDIFSLIYHFSFLFPSLWETARYRLKYCLKGPLSPKQPTNQHILLKKYFCQFCVVFKYVYFSELVTAQKIDGFVENHRFAYAPCHFSPLAEIQGSIALLENPLTFEGVQWRKIIQCMFISRFLARLDEIQEELLYYPRSRRWCRRQR